jgi:hypothetical protein
MCLLGKVAVVTGAPVGLCRYWHKGDIPSCAAHVRFRG